MKKYIWLLLFLLIPLQVSASSGVLKGLLLASGGTPPTTPVISATAGNTQNTITLTSGDVGALTNILYWDTTSRATYDLYANSISNATLVAASFPGTPYVHTGRTNGTPYYYRLCGTDLAGQTCSSEVSGTPTGGGSCTGQTEYASAANAYASFGGSEYAALRFVAASSFNLTQIGVYLGTENTPTGLIHAYLYNALSTSPGTSLLATSTNTINASTITTSFTEFKFQFPSTALTSSTNYYIIVGNEQNDGIRYALDTNITLAYGDMVSGNGMVSWTNGNNMQGRLTTYSGTCP